MKCWKIQVRVLQKWVIIYNYQIYIESLCKNIGNNYENA